MARVALVCSFRFPGKYAFTALIGALEAAADLADVELCLPRDTPTLLADAQRCIDSGARTVVAWSFYSPSFPECAQELQAVRAQLRGDYVTIAGGVHASAEPEETLSAGFDFICIGEGERTLVELLRRVRDGQSLESTPGLARRGASGVERAPRPPQVQLDEFPPFSPARNIYGAIELTRGCVYACRFCQTPYFSKAVFRHRSAREVAKWARLLRETGRRDVRFVSPTSLSYGSGDASVNLAAVEELLALVREAMGPDGRIFFGTFPSEVRPEHVTPEALAVLAKYVDNDSLIIGGQSGSARVLESSKRGHDVEAIVRAVRVSREAGFVPHVDFILGLPGEDDGDLEATIALMKQLGALGARVHGHTFMPLPGTPFRDAPPGAVSAPMRAQLDRLASEQRLYGHWQQQQHTAKQLAERLKQTSRRRPGTPAPGE